MGMDACVRGLTRRWMPRSETGSGPGSVPSGGSLVDRVLAARGIHADDAEAYLNPSLKGLHDPGLLTDIDKAAERILGAVRSGERVAIFGDYDVDGITASAILVHMIRAISPGADLVTYIPHRVDEGYGINDGALERLAADGAKVVVSVDCGITAIGPARTARRLGIDLIITDHHNPPATREDLPEAFAVVHPRHPDSAYPFGELCGAGVAYKLAWRMATMHAGGERVSPALRGVLLELLSFAALGTIADIVPLVDENRVIARHGLVGIARTSNPGLRALIKASGLESSKVDAEDVGFRLAPRLNAVGRLGHALEALELLTEATGERATELAESLSTLNDERRRVEREIFERACELAESQGMTGEDRRAIVLAADGWHPGVVGIVCSKLTEKYGRPAILMCRDGDACKGSGRSIEGFNLHGALEACAEHLTRFGGHDMAAGLACETERFEAFADRLVDHVNGLLGPEDLVAGVRYDIEASVSELDVHEGERFERLAPFGPGNPRVRVRVKGKIAGSPKVFGQRGDHLSFQLIGPDRGSGFRVVGWGWSQHAADIPPGATIEAIVEPKVSRWNGRATVEPVLSDLRVVASGSDHSVVASTDAKVPARS